MDALNDIVARLEQQKKAIETALAALHAVTGSAPAGVRTKRAYTRKAAKAKKGGISAEGRARLAEAMKKRWAVKRAAATARGPRKKSA
jgi:hypothetical protein